MSFLAKSWSWSKILKTLIFLLTILKQ